MQKINETLKNSLNELKNIKVLCVLGMLGALSIVLYTITVQITDVLQIGFDPVCNILADCLFGPVVGAIFGGAMDMLNFFLNPRGAFNPGLTLNAIISGDIDFDLSGKHTLDTITPIIYDLDENGNIISVKSYLSIASVTCEIELNYKDKIYIPITEYDKRDGENRIISVSERI